MVRQKPSEIDSLYVTMCLAKSDQVVLVIFLFHRKLSFQIQDVFAKAFHFPGKKYLTSCKSVRTLEMLSILSCFQLGKS